MNIDTSYTHISTFAGQNNAPINQSGLSCQLDVQYCVFLAPLITTSSKHLLSDTLGEKFNLLFFFRPSFCVNLFRDLA